MKRVLLVLLIPLLLINIGFCSTESLDFSECRYYYTPNDSGNITTYEQIRVCSPSFPQINQRITLDKDSPLFVMPKYNFSANIKSEIYSEANNLKEDLNNATSQIIGLTSLIEKSNSKSKERDAALNNVINDLRSSFSTELNNKTMTLDSRLTILENIARTGNSGDANMPIYGLIATGIICIILWLVYKSGYFNKQINNRHIPYSRTETPKDFKPKPETINTKKSKK